MPFSDVPVHFIWATKNRKPIITKELKPLLLKHIKENSIKKGIFIYCMNCTEDHIHLLLSIGTEQTQSKIAMLLKGESSYWVNKEKLIPGKFEWQDEYICIGVCQSALSNVRRYIANQEEHHKKQSFKEEWDEIIKKLGLG